MRCNTLSHSIVSSWEFAVNQNNQKKNHNHGKKYIVGKGIVSDKKYGFNYPDIIQGTMKYPI